MISKIKYDTIQKQSYVEFQFENKAVIRYQLGIGIVATQDNTKKEIDKVNECLSEHDCKEYWSNNRPYDCAICGLPQSEYYDAHICSNHVEYGQDGKFCGWCGKDLNDYS